MWHRNSWLKDSSYTIEEQAKIYDITLQQVYDNPRWYLDNLEYLRDYRVDWHCYSRTTTKGRRMPTLPYKTHKGL